MKEASDIALKSLHLDKEDVMISIKLRRLGKVDQAD